MKHMWETIYKNTIQPLDQVEKRLRFVISAILMTAVMLVSTFFFFDKAPYFVIIFIILSFVVTYLSILKGIEKAEWFTLFFMPLLFTLAFYLFFLLFPIRWLTRVPFLLMYSFSFYALLLTSNIFNVGVERSLQLYRAAFSVNYFYQTIILFLVSSVTLSFRPNPIVNGLILGMVSFLLSLQLLWSVRPKIYIERQIMQYSFLMSIIVFQAAITLSFVPLKASIFALFITALYYSVGGLLYHYMEQRLFSQTLREYSIVISFVLAIILLSLQW